MPWRLELSVLTCITSEDHYEQDHIGVYAGENNAAALTYRCVCRRRNRVDGALMSHSFGQWRL